MKTKPVIVLLLSSLATIQLFAQQDEATAKIKTDDSLTVPKENFKLSGYAEVNYNRHYLWRGALWGSDNVAQPELHFDYKKFWLAFYTNLNLRPKDLSLEYYK